MLGLTRLVRDRRCLLYCLSLGYILFSNYYIAYFIILFTILYFPICLFQYNSFRQPLKMLASVGRFAAFSLIGGGLAAFLALPTYFSLQLTSAAKDTFPTAITHYFDLFDYIGQHFMLVSPTIRDGMPNMYAGCSGYAADTDLFLCQINFTQAKANAPDSDCDHDPQFQTSMRSISFGMDSISPISCLTATLLFIFF